MPDVRCRVLSTSNIAGPSADHLTLPRPWTERVAGALAHRNFRLLWFAALGSTIGTWMQKYAQGLLVYDLTQSKFYLGLDDFLSQLPILLFMLIGGVVADRHDRRRLLTASQYIQAFSAFALALLVWTGHIHVAFIFALSFISGCGQAFGGPGLSGDDSVARAQTRSVERDRAQLHAVQPLARARPWRRRGRPRDDRHGLVFCLQRPLVLLRRPRARGPARCRRTSRPPNSARSAPNSATACTTSATTG